MASETTYVVADYDTLAGGAFTELSLTLVTWTGGSGRVINDLPDSITSTEGKLVMALITGDEPDNNETMTQGGVTADCSGPLPSGDADVLAYPAYQRRDLEMSAAGAVTRDAGAPIAQVTHSFEFDGGGTAAVPTEILTFSPGNQQFEVIAISGSEIEARVITPIDTFGLPDDNDTFTGSVAATGDALNQLVHDRSYSVLHWHRLASDMNDDRYYTGDDVMSVTKPVPTNRSTSAIIQNLGAVTITDAVSQFMFGGSLEQGTGITRKLYSGMNIQVTDSDGDTEPQLIKDDTLLTPWWANTLNPNSIQGDVRILIVTVEDGVPIDGQRIKGRLARYEDTYFSGSTTLGFAATALALFSSPDVNNTTPEGTIGALSPVYTYGYQTIDFLNGNGATPFAGSVDFDGETSADTYEHAKYVHREDSSSSLFGRNARLFDGFTLNFKVDGEAGAGFDEGGSAETLVWGYELTYNTLAGGTFTVGNVLEDDTTGGKGRILFDNGSTFAILALDGTTQFVTTNAMTEYSGGSATGVTAATNGAPVNNSAAGTALVCAVSAVNGNLYVQQLTGVTPVDNQTVRGATSDTTALVDAATSLQTRVVNTQFIGTYTGTNFLTNYGWAIDVSDAIAGDLFPNLLGVNQAPPDTRTSTVTGLEADYYITIHPWDGSTLDTAGNPQATFLEDTLDGALVSGVTTSVVVTTGVNDNTPQAGWLRIQDDVLGEFFLWQHSAHDATNTYTMVGTAPQAAADDNDVMRAPWDDVAGATSVNYSAILGTPDQYVISAKRGGTSSPIKATFATATFPFTVNLQPVSDA